MGLNGRTPAETLSFIIGELAQETPEDRKRLIDALIAWFKLGRRVTLSELQGNKTNDG